MNYAIDKKLIDNAIGNCENISYPVLVNGQDYANDLALALRAVNRLVDKVKELEKVIELMADK